MKKGIENTVEWFNAAIPNPSREQIAIQVGCHLEEVCEMLESINLGVSNAMQSLSLESNEFKINPSDYYIHKIEDCDPKALLDSLCDQIVTAVGVAHMMGFDIIGALGEVNRSNFSKFEDGLPVFDANGKIAKGKDYTRPELEPFLKK